MKADRFVAKVDYLRIQHESGLLTAHEFAVGVYNLLTIGQLVGSKVFSDVKDEIVVEAPVSGEIDTKTGLRYP